VLDNIRARSATLAASPDVASRKLGMDQQTEVVDVRLPNGARIGARSNTASNSAYHAILRGRPPAIFRVADPGRPAARKWRCPRCYNEHPASTHDSFGWLGRFGLVMAGSSVRAGAAFATNPVTTAEAAGCSECWGVCNPCSSACITNCHHKCNCNCTGGCFACNPTWIQAHMLYILGYIPNCTCPAC
jgi:hypothetical protein